MGTSVVFFKVNANVKPPPDPKTVITVNFPKTVSQPYKVRTPL